MRNIDRADKLIITNFTDPICTWCWGSEPLFRLLETHYPDQIEFRYVMGGLVEDITASYDTQNAIGSDGPEEANRQIIAHWLEASETHGMPVEEKGFRLFSKDRLSSYPQNIAYKAAQKVDPSKADKYLRRIREATAAQAAVTSKDDVLIEHAVEVGFDRDEFSKMYYSDIPKNAFRGDLYINQTLGVTGFPTTEIKYNNERQILRGYHPFSSYVDAISQLTHGSVQPVVPKPTEDALFRLMEGTPHIALMEITKAFDFPSITDTEKWLEPFVDSGKLVKIPQGNGYFFERR